MKPYNRKDYVNCIRGLRYIILNEDDTYDKIREYRKAFGEGFHIASNWIFQNCKDVTNFSNTNKTRLFENPDKFFHQGITEEIRDELTKVGITKSPRNVAMAALANYKSFKQRPRNGISYKDRFPKSPIKLKPNKSIRFDDGGVVDKGNGVLIMPGLNGDRIELKYYHPGTVSRNRKYLSKDNKGGTLYFESGVWRFTKQIKKPIQYQYEPQFWLGSDFGARGNNFIVLADINGNNVYRIESTPDILQLGKEIGEVNRVLNDRINTKGGKRRYFNNKREKLHKEHNKLICKYIIPQIIDYVQALRCGLVIDGVTTGDIKGTWGQDKLVPELTKQCENLGLPFYISKPSYTSQTCPECGYRHKSNRNGEIFKCKECSYTNNADIVGAINGAKSATKHQLDVYVTN